MPGDSAVTVFVPNQERTYIKFTDTVTNVWKVKDVQKIPLNLGVDSLGSSVVVDLTELPHLLVAGSTGAGKSTLLASILASLIYCVESSRLQIILSDTKQVEFGHFIGAPHLLFEPATSVYQTLERMDWLIDEMDNRLKKLAKLGQRNITEHNEHSSGSAAWPYILLCIDEVADLLAYKGEKRGESKISQEKISKLASKARASGIHIIAATQRPSVDIINGVIKANFPARLSFRLPSGADSRTVLSTEGAEHLLSRGDMLFINPNKAGLARLHAPYARIEDIRAAVDAACRR
jgi:S-DNA-T family DNA segregation ATPase FtsK/SpoIIIE